MIFLESFEQHAIHLDLAQTHQQQTGVGFVSQLNNSAINEINWLPVHYRGWIV